MSDISTTTAVAGAKTLWVAVGVLGAAVVGLGGALYYTQTQQGPQAMEPVVATPAPTPVAAAPVPPSVPVVREKAVTVAPAPVARSKPKPAVTKAREPALVEAPIAVKPPEPKPVCIDCATVAAVTPVEREGESGGTGAIAGGVLGALVGNQVGRGQGKDIATVIGAIGGGIAGNQVEKKMKKITVYQVELRMDDGSRRRLELSEAVSVGARVRVEGNNLAPLPAGN